MDVNAVPVGGDPHPPLASIQAQHVFSRSKLPQRRLVFASADFQPERFAPPRRLGGHFLAADIVAPLHAQFLQAPMAA